MFVICLLIIPTIPISLPSEYSIADNLLESESLSDYDNLKLLLDTNFTSSFSHGENDNHDAFETRALFPRAQLAWTHQEGTELEFRYPKDRTANLPDCKEYAYVSELFEWNYNTIPTKVDIKFQISNSMSSMLL